MPELKLNSSPSITDGLFFRCLPFLCDRDGQTITSGQVEISSKLSPAEVLPLAREDYESFLHHNYTVLLAVDIVLVGRRI